jgi:hypothetical protein
LGIELSKEEQISFLNAHLDLKSQFIEIKRDLDEIKKVTNETAGKINPRDVSKVRDLSAWLNNEFGSYKLEIILSDQW